MRYKTEYKAMRETRKEIVIVDKWVEMKWNPSSAPYYINRGYHFTKYNETFMVMINDLPDGSHVKVTAKCPMCKFERKLNYQSITKIGHTLCRKCAPIIDLTGLKFNRWFVVSFSHTGESGAMWNCVCDCGNENQVSGHFLTLGRANSCGCYQKDVVRALSGSNSPNWKGGRITLVCKQCGSEYTAKRHERKRSNFCSKECNGQWKSENMSRENSPLWKSDKTDEEREKGRNYPGYKKWAKNVLQRDGYTCVVCNKRGGNLEAHHLHSYATDADKRLELDNGVTIHSNEHAEFHLDFMGGWGKPCTKRDFEIWLMIKRNK